MISILVVMCLQFLLKVKGLYDMDNEHCISVPYWQCKDDFSGLVEDGEGLMDVRRTSYVEKMPLLSNDFDVCCPVECGNRKMLTHDIMAAKNYEEEIFGFRILGDNNAAEFGEFPWMLGILEGRTYRCGGSLVHPQVAITAAHCVNKESRYKIRAGEWNWETSMEPIPHQDRLVKKIIVHPNFHPQTLQNDIAIVILERPFMLRENVGIMCLPYPGIKYERRRCVVAGWGRNSHKKGTYQATLKRMELPILTKDACVKTLQDVKFGRSFRLHKSFLCAGGEGKKDTCKGDGGSPLMCPIVNRPGKYQQVGIVSWGLTCGVANTPGVYVNIEIFLDWIDDVLESYGFDTTVYKYR
ncbi:phenoloxidase-activating factor 2-like isoform X2 [Diorhabda sublineata]|uniref:phenoloxidase-activating factor 2-like isoform X2 n=1 Tax=Diorhabda sublineata TaxID=1163346 RepID=UPI0024E16A52|nr:phenoloxidase-activating factor 2-like isoform X2 [Diorhabda sublineata]